MRHVDHTEWELLKQHSAAHLENQFWQSGTFCVTPNGTPGHPVRMPEIWDPPVSPSPLHLIR